MKNPNTYYWLTALLLGSLINFSLFIMLPKLGRTEQMPKPEIISVEFMAWQQPVSKPKVNKPKKIKPKKPAPKTIKPKPKPVKKPKPKIKPRPKPVNKPVLTEKIVANEIAPVVEIPPEPKRVVEHRIPESKPNKEETPVLPTPTPIFKLTSMPRVVHQGSLIYPQDMREQGREAMVKLEILLDVKGRVRKIDIVKSGGEAFDKAAVDSMKNTIFLPGNINGKPVAVRLKKKIRFRLN